MSLRSVIGRVFPTIRGWQWWNFNWGICRHSRRVQRSRSPTNWTDTLSRSCSVNQQKARKSLEGENFGEFYCSWNLFLRYALVGLDRFYCRTRNFSPSNSCCYNYTESPKCSPSLGLVVWQSLVFCFMSPLDSFVNHNLFFVACCRHIHSECWYYHRHHWACWPQQICRLFWDHVTSPDCHVAIMCLLQHSVVEGQAEHIGLDETLTCSVTSGSYRHFVLVSEIQVTRI